MDNILDFRNIDILKNLLTDEKLRESIRLLCVFGCGGGEVIYLTNDDRVYGYGRNRFGGLGLGTDEEAVDKPRLNEFLSYKQLSNIFCGFEHWIALTKSGRCYAWGHNQFGQLGIPTVVSTSAPKVIKQLENKGVVTVSCGGFFNLALTADGLVYGWGDNQFGQLGDNSTEVSKIPKLIDFSEKITSISSGIKHSMAVTVSGKVFVWGLNGFGQLGRIYEHYSFVKQPELIPGFESTLFDKAVCGPNHSLLLTIDGTVYSFGDNKGGQIGNGGMDCQFIPFKVFNNIKIKEIIAHKENDISIAVSSDNRYYVWGLANNRRYLTPKLFTSGDSVFDLYAKLVKKSLTFKTVVISDDLKSWEQINRNFTENNNTYERLIKTSVPKCISGSVESSALSSNQINRTLFDFLCLKQFNYYELMSINKEFIESVRLFCVYQRGNSLIFVTKEDKVYGMGFNRNGGLGLDHKRENIHKPEFNTILSDKQLVDIACGFEHCIGLTALGECYSWGKNIFGQLGIGNHESPKLPEKIKFFNDQKIVQICCGSYHSMALTSDGELFSWGHNTFAQLGDKTYNSRETPTLVLMREKIGSIASGLNHSLAVTIDGNVYVWGTNEFGQLGRPKWKDIQKNRDKAMNNRPQKLYGFDDMIVLKAVCGPNHSVILTSEGYVYTFGDNTKGQIGDGSTINQFRPFLLSSDIKFKEIIANRVNDFSVAVSFDNKVYFWGSTQSSIYSSPQLLAEPFGKSLFDIYLKLAKEKVTYKVVDVFNDIIDLKDISINENQSKNNFNGLSSQSTKIDNDLDNNNNSCEDQESARISDSIYSSENYSVRNQYSVSICGQIFLEYLNKSFNTENCSDLKIISDNKVIYCHKTVLRIRNENFWQTLKQNSNENETEIRINPKIYDCFYAFLQFLYGIQPEISVDFISDLRQMAIVFNEPEVLDLCQKYLQKLIEILNIENVCAFYKTSIDLSLDELQTHCLKLISKNLKQILKSESFQSMDDSLSKKLLNSLID